MTIQEKEFELLLDEINNSESRAKALKIIEDYLFNKRDFDLQKRAEQTQTIIELKEQIERYEDRKKFKGPKARIVLRCLAFVFVLGLLCITHLYFVFKRTIEFLKYGGEFVKYSDEKEYKSINDIYLQLKNQNKS